MRYLLTLLSVFTFSLLAASEVKTLQNQLDAVSETNVMGERIPKPPDAIPEIKNPVGLFFTGDFLFWIAQQDGLDYAFVNTTPIVASQTLGTIKSMTFRWRPGFRIGAGYKMGHDQWDTYAFWTRLNSEINSSVTAPLGGSLTSIWIPTGTSLVDASSATANWRLYYNILDIELGRAYYTSRALSVRPFVGIRGAWINQQFNLTYTGNGTQIMTRGRSDSDGYGLRTGINLNWAFSKHWGFLGKASGSLLYTRFGVHDKTLQFLNPTPIFNVNDTIFRVNGNGEISGGFTYRTLLSKDRYFLRLGLMYEFVQWFNFNHMRNFITVSRGNFVEENGDLGLQGATFTARLDF